MSYDFLHHSGLKITPSRKRIIDAIESLNTEATIKNIYAICEDINSSTIYRFIEILIKKNVINKNINNKGEVFFSFKKQHDHFFTCIKCGKTEKIDYCPLDEKDNRINGNIVIDHSVLLSGICINCQHTL